MNDSRSGDGGTGPAARRMASAARGSRVLLAGAAGFIGSHLADRLLADGFEVIGVDNFVSGRAANLRHLGAHPSFTLLERDVVEPLALEGPLDWVLHFASLASPPRYLARPIETLRTNGEGTYRLLELAKQKGASFLLASTSEVYGDPAEHPQREGYWGNVNPIGPRSVYDEAKRYAEAMVTAYHGAHGLPVRLIRIFNTYGPRMDPDDGRVVSNFIAHALRGLPLTIYGDGSQTRSFQYIDDLVEGVRCLMETDYSGPVNLGNPEEYTMLELAALVQEVAGVALPLRHEPLPVDDPRQRRPDISLARRLLGWQPHTSVRDGIDRTVAHFRAELAATGVIAEDPVRAADRAVSAVHESGEGGA